MLVTAYANGVSMGTPPGKNDHERAKRGAVVGWSAAAVRRHTRWLYSIDADGLDGTGIAFTLTLKKCPLDSADWQRLVKSWCDRMTATGDARVHWVVEWQRPRPVPQMLGPHPWQYGPQELHGDGQAPRSSSVPHLHAAVYFDTADPDTGIAPEPTPVHELIARGLLAWLDLASAWGAAWQAQDAKEIDGAIGWLAYLSKHAARGVKHYQRQGKPRGWRKTGRLWGKRGDWPEVDPERLHLSTKAGHRLRRLARSWRIADARAELFAALAAPLPPSERGKKAHAARIATAKRRVSAARGMLRNGTKRAPVLGVSEWMGPDVLNPLLALLRAEGHALLTDEELAFQAEQGEPEWVNETPMCGCSVRTARTAAHRGSCAAAWPRPSRASGPELRALSRMVASGWATAGSMRNGVPDASGAESSEAPIPLPSALW